MSDALIKPGTPLPWTQKVEPISYPECSDQDLPVVIRGGQGQEIFCIAENYGAELICQHKLDAFYIVTACNAYPSLVEALEKAETIVEGWIALGKETGMPTSNAEEAHVEILAALSKAKGEVK